MIKSLAELKRLKVGDKLRLVYRFGEKLDSLKEVGKVQSNAIAFKKGDGLSWLYLPRASLVEFTTSGFRTYAPGLRPLTPQEQRVYDNRPQDQKQTEIDALTDGNTMYWRTKAYYHEKGMDYMQDFRGKHLRFVDGKPMIYDPAVKGKLELEYVFE